MLPPLDVLASPRIRLASSGPAPISVMFLPPVLLVSTAPTTVEPPLTVTSPVPASRPPSAGTPMSPATAPSFATTTSLSRVFVTVPTTAPPFLTVRVPPASMTSSPTVEPAIAVAFSLNVRLAKLSTSGTALTASSSFGSRTSSVSSIPSIPLSCRLSADGEDVSSWSVGGSASFSNARGLSTGVYDPTAQSEGQNSGSGKQVPQPRPPRPAHSAQTPLSSEKTQANSSTSPMPFEPLLPPGASTVSRLYCWFRSSASEQSYSAVAGAPWAVTVAPSRYSPSSPHLHTQLSSTISNSTRVGSPPLRFSVVMVTLTRLSP